MERWWKVLIISISCSLSLAEDMSLDRRDLLKDSEMSNHRLTCPTWHMPTKVNESSCECGPSLYGVVKCNEWNNSVSLLACYCMTQSKLLNETIVGNCLYTCAWKFWTLLSNETAALDGETCLPLNRAGQLCGECVHGYAPPIYSYNIGCVKCTYNTTNWLKYIAVAFFPLTIFYFVIMVFRISASSPRLRCFVLACQLFFMPGHLRYLYALQKNYIQSHKYESTFAEVTISLLSIWNLDFLRAVYEPFCIHPRVHPLGVLALDYLTAVYPLFLIVATFCCIKAYDKFSLIRLVLRPVHRCCFHIRKEWHIHRSLLDAFATFLLLSYVKILNISFDLLIPTTTYDMNGERSFTFLYYSGNIKVFEGEHIPYAILALVMIIVFNIIPLILLAVYHCYCYQKLMNSCNCHSQTLHVFMDIFSGCYRTKPFDCRHFSVVYLIIRILNLVVFSFTLSRFYYPFAAILYLLSAVLVTAVQPYKCQLYNKLDTAMLLLLTLGYIAATAYALSPTEKLSTTFIVIMILTCISILLYMISIAIYWVIPHRIKEWMKTYVVHIHYKCVVCTHLITVEEDFLDVTDYFNSSRELTGAKYTSLQI